MQPPTATIEKVDTATFVQMVPSANEFEIQSSQLALTKSVDADVRAFAEQMVKDHTKAGVDFKAALDKVDTTASVKPATGMAAEEQAKLQELQEAGDDFQAKYVAAQVDAHREAVALFQAYANDGKDPALKEFAKATLPTLQQHEQHVKELQAAHKG